jgi:hypothetical protein
VLRRLRGEDGAVAVTVGLLLTVLVLMSAYVLDLASLRMDRRTSQTMSDLAATAGALELQPGAYDAVAACEAAWAYFLENVGDATGAVPPPCSDFATVCQNGVTTDTPRTRQGTLGPYTVRITIPVADADGTGTDSDVLMEGRIEPEFDGWPCERVGISISRDRTFSLAQVAGFNGSSTTAKAVARRHASGDDDSYSSLILLDRHHCHALYVSGQGGVEVRNATKDGKVFPGQITLDTMADEPGNSIAQGQCGNGHAINVNQSNAGAYIYAEGAIYSYGLFEGRPPAQIYDFTDIPGRLDPVPQRGGIITRARVDSLFNCRANYASLVASAANPQYPSALQPMTSDDNCYDPTPPYIDELRAALQNTALMNTAGWSVFPDHVPGASCKAWTGVLSPATPVDLTPADPTDPLTPAGNDRWFINCDATGNDIFSPQDVTITDTTYVVSANQIDITNSQRLEIDGDTTQGTVLYVRNNGIGKSGQASMSLTETFVYLEDGEIDLTGDGLLEWWTPLDQANSCDGYSGGGLPPGGCFVPLVLWSNSSGLHDLGGQSSLDIRGTVFTPNADPFRLSGQSPQTLDKAQFFSRKIEVSGQGVITMFPDPDYNIPDPRIGGGLIR